MPHVTQHYACSLLAATNQFSVIFSEKTIHVYGEDGGVYIFPECIANVERELLNRDDHLMRNFSSKKTKSTSCLTSVVQKTYMQLFSIAMHYLS